MEPPNPGVYFVLAVVSVVFLTGIAYLVLLVARWNSTRIRYVTPHVRSRPMTEQTDRRFAAVSREETNNETEESERSAAEIEEEKITFAETEVAHALALLIIAGELDLTKAVKIGCNAKSGAKYQKHSGLVKTAIEQQKEQSTPIAGRSTGAKFAPDPNR
jgi:hypothetical protein